ncbi:MAG: anti-sigma factor [Mycobacteriaceae bacterium]|uniref:anti-sigma factor n=1 Tax=Corynebacterium sp. TaxID=1720 RepID=UPI003F95ADC4
MGGFSDVGHLTPEVVAALVDGELGKGAEHRARIHLVHCEECRTEVRAQRQAAERLRGSDPLDGIHVSGSLLDRLTQIPTVCGDNAEQAEDEPGDVGPDGRRRPATLSGRMAAAARRVQRMGSAAQSKSPRKRRER